jgi:hypothetical protein
VTNSDVEDTSSAVSVDAVDVSGVDVMSRVEVPPAVFVTSDEVGRLDWYGLLLEEICVVEWLSATVECTPSTDDIANVE